MNLPPFRLLAAALVAAFAASSLPVTARAATVSPSLYQGLQWRFVGPLRGGRTKAIAGIAAQPNRFYIGAVNGGVWRTDDAGRTWQPLFDNEPTQSIGALALAPSDPGVIYAGSGEGEQRPDLSIGNGIYTSTDAGKTWTHLGLRDGQQINRIVVDPKDPNRLFVAVEGHPYGPNAERGIFRSLDGGATFTKVLYRDENTGGNDVAIDPSDPQIVYATMWAARSAPWEAGPFEISGSGVYKSTDGGATWAKLTNGFPPRIGRAEIGISPSNANVVYAGVDAPTGCAIYRSDDAGAHFSLTSSDDRVCARAGDLLTLTVDPREPMTVYATSTSIYKSTDGGKTFTAFKGAPGGDDYQELWINPSQPNVMAFSSDQGAGVSVDAGATWSSWYNQPTGQMFHVNADDRFPYWVCGGQQDSGSACVVSRGAWGQVNERDWHPAGAEEYGYVVPDPLQPGVFFGGKVERFSEETGQTQEVSPNPLRGKPYRVVRTQPIAFDRFDKHLMYFGANQIYATRDQGLTWHTISPDLSRGSYAIPSSIAAFENADPEKGGHRGVVYALAPSYTARGTLWAGTDDGQLWITRDGGAHWSNITPRALSAWSKVSQIDASHFDNGTAYVAVNRLRLDDLRPFVYKTHDGGTSWTAITNGLPNEPVNAVRADPKARGLLYAATEDGVYVSFDDGERWQSLQENLPHSSMRDIVVHGNDLVVATHGRGFWILDDVEPLRELARTSSFSAPHLFTPSLAYRVRRNTNTDTPLPPEEPHGQNPPDGAILYYALPSNATNVTLTILDAHGNVVRRYSSNEPAPEAMQFDKPSYWEAPFEPLSTAAGMHRFAWNLHETSPASVGVDLAMAANYEATPRIPQGALVVPGRYTVELTVDGRSTRQPLELAMDPRIHVTQRALQDQYEMAHQTALLLDSTYRAMLAAKKAENEKRLELLKTLNGRLTAMMELIEGADRPVPDATRRAFCDLRTAALGAQGAMASRIPTCF